MIITKLIKKNDKNFYEDTIISFFDSRINLKFLCLLKFLFIQCIIPLRKLKKKRCCDKICKKINKRLKHRKRS
jgi:hypothetical protein